MTTNSVELMQMIYQVQMDNAELTAQGLGLKILLCVLIFWLCVSRFGNVY